MGSKGSLVTALGDRWERRSGCIRLISLICRVALFQAGCATEQKTWGQTRVRQTCHFQFISVSDSLPGNKKYFKSQRAWGFFFFFLSAFQNLKVTSKKCKYHTVLSPVPQGQLLGSVLFGEDTCLGQNWSIGRPWCAGQLPLQRGMCFLKPFFFCLRRSEKPIIQFSFHMSSQMLIWGAYSSWTSHQEKRQDRGTTVTEYLMPLRNGAHWLSCSLLGEKWLEGD